MNDFMDGIIQIAIIMCLIMFAGNVLTQSNERDNVYGLKYDGCYEQYAFHKVSADDFPKFMKDCLAK